MDASEFGPCEPFASWRQSVQASAHGREVPLAGVEAESEAPIEIMLVGFNKLVTHPLRYSLVHWIFRWAMTTEECPNCGQAVDVDTALWRESDAALICNVCAGTPPGILIAWIQRNRS